jgi:hypothetical protein
MIESSLSDWSRDDLLGGVDGLPNAAETDSAGNLGY